MTPTDVPLTPQVTTRLLWLDLTRKCQLECTHCYNASGPGGSHGTMAREDWISVLDQAARLGVHDIQFIGSEPTMHPNFADLVDHALTIGLHVEVYSNLVHVSKECWTLFQRKGLTLATSYYSDQAAEHDRMTGRRSHARTRSNIERAMGLGIPLRVGIVDGGDGQRVTEARRDLEDLGVTRIGVDHVRPFGRAAQDRMPDPADLCGRCGTDRAAISPSGEVSPCVFSGEMSVGNVQDSQLASILNGTSMVRANRTIRSAVRMGNCQPDECHPDQTPCYPAETPCAPRGYLPPACTPDDGQCDPGVFSTHCNPRR